MIGSHDSTLSGLIFNTMCGTSKTCICPTFIDIVETHLSLQRRKEELINEIPFSPVPFQNWFLFLLSTCASNSQNYIFNYLKLSMVYWYNRNRTNRYELIKDTSYLHNQILCKILFSRCLSFNKIYLLLSSTPLWYDNNQLIITSSASFFLLSNF